MRISIVTPSYNQAAYLEFTIRSVLGQGYPDLEYWIMDGGSDDGSLEIIRKYESQLTGWVSHPDKGQSDAINKGLRQASGQVLAWLNSDDMYAPGVLSEVARFFEANPEVGMVFGDAVSFDQDGNPLNALDSQDWGLPGLVAFNIICQPAVFMRKSALEKAGYLDEDYHCLLDHHLWLRIAQNTQIRHVPKLWAFARHHSDAKNVALAPKFGEEAFQVLSWMQTQPVLAELVAQNRDTVIAMVYRFNARYLLDGDLAWPALQSYWRSFISNPKIALQEWHRMLYAGLSLLGLGKLGRVYYQLKKNRSPESIRKLGIENIHQLYPKEGQLDLPD
jgi:glycosyltransferase involved in cell wall biosynthesis